MDLLRWSNKRLANGAQVEEVTVDPEGKASGPETLIKLGAEVVREIRPPPPKTTKQDDPRAAS